MTLELTEMDPRATRIFSRVAWAAADDGKLTSRRTNHNKKTVAIIFLS
jgi:hypothetical protein